MKSKNYTLIMTYQYTNFEPVCEKTKSKVFESDNLVELVDILTTYINGFILKEKNTGSWIYFSAEIQNNMLLTYDLEYKIYEVSMARKD